MKSHHHIWIPTLDRTVYCCTACQAQIHIQLQPGGCDLQVSKGQDNRDIPQKEILQVVVRHFQNELKAIYATKEDMDPDDFRVLEQSVKIILDTMLTILENPS